MMFRGNPSHSLTHHLLTKTLKTHLRPTLLLAYPVMLSQLGHMLVSFVDTVVVGHITPAAESTVSLAAVSVGVTTTTVLLVMGIGLSMGSVPLVAAADGRRDLPALGRLLVSSVWLNVAAGVVLAGLGQFIPPLLHHLGQPAAVVALATPWVRVMSWSLLPLMIFQGFREYAEGLGLTRQAMWLSLGANVVNALLCYALVFGHWGFAPMGMLGTAWASLVSRVLMAVLMAAYVLFARRLAPYRAAVASWWALHLGTVRRLLALGAPIGVQMMCEMGAFGFSALMIGWISVTSQAAHQVAITVAATTYMAASGIATAGTIRVGNLRGAGDMPGARQAGFAAYWLTFAFMGSMGLVLALGRHVIPHFIASDPAVMSPAATLLLVAAFFQVSDGLGAVGLGVLRGLEDVKIPSLVVLLAYWAAALPLGYFLGFKLHMGAVGVWVGLLLGLTLVAGVLLVRFRREAVEGFVPPDPQPDEAELAV